jgi:[ribosomal protein S5]-alanine N-acetyltransferase
MQNRPIAVQAVGPAGAAHPGRVADGQQRIGLTELTMDDADELATLLAGSVSFHRPWVSYPTTPGGVRDYVGEVGAQGGLLFAVRRLDNDVLIGLVSLSRITRGAWQAAECGCAVGAPFRGNGYMAEAMTQAVTYAMAQLGLHRIEALVRSGNTASQRMLTAAGFRPEGVARSSVRVNGAWLDHVRWAITADDLKDPDPT